MTKAEKVGACCTSNECGTGCYYWSRGGQAHRVTGPLKFDAYDPLTWVINGMNIHLEY